MVRLPWSWFPITTAPAAANRQPAARFSADLYPERAGIFYEFTNASPAAREHDHEGLMV
jgi:hypothetical protein